MVYDRRGYDDRLLLRLYERLLLPRMIEEKMLNLLRQGRISKWFSGIGQEAIAVAAASVLRDEEFILPMHRNLGVFTTRDVPLERLFAQFQGKPSGFTKGRDRSFHFGAPEHRIVGMISHLGPQLALADGIALADRLEGQGRVTVVFSGEGGTSEGDFHEALNVAAVWNLPVIFVIENNGYGLSTPVSEQFRCARLADRGAGYGMEACTIDGNNILEVYATLDGYADALRRDPRPVLVECMTFRMRGHEEASGVKYVPTESLEAWAGRDPVRNYEAWLLEGGLLTDAGIEELRAANKQRIERALEQAFAAPGVTPSAEGELADVYVPHDPAPREASGPAREIRFVDAVSEGLAEGMERHPNLVIMGQDVAAYGGVFKITEGFADRFGTERVRNTPLCESAIVGAGLGLSIRGWKSVVEMQFADFVTCGFNQIVNNLAKVHYRWGQSADVVIRMPTGAGVGAGPFHSQSNEAWFTHVAGLKVVYPATPEDAKGLLLAAIEDPNPVLYFEHKALYRSLQGPVPEDGYTVPIGRARLDRDGADLAIVTYGMGVHWARQALDRHPAIDGAILDLRSLQPIDWDAVGDLVRRTGKALVLHEDTLTGGIGGEVAAWIGEHCFEALDAPVVRVGSLDTPVPFDKGLEAQFLASARLDAALERLAAY
jgi:2-oxoisovalerate dehydrogenase E1 component